MRNKKITVFVVLSEREKLKKKKKVACRICSRDRALGKWVVLHFQQGDQIKPQ